MLTVWSSTLYKTTCQFATDGLLKQCILFLRLALLLIGSDWGTCDAYINCIALQGPDAIKDICLYYVAVCDTALPSQYCHAA